MHIHWVRAISFGELVDQTLRLGPGLNIVVGPNESGKSTWHAAMYATLCGFPGAAHRRASDELFAEYRKPHDPTVDLWQVEGMVELAPGRRVLIHQDLLDPDASRVTPADDSDAGPIQAAPGQPLDVTRWLGLNRRSYAATAWVEQAATRTAFVGTDGRNELQLAVAAVIGEDDVDAAVRRIDDLRRTHVGDVDAGPLARAHALVSRRRSERDEADQTETRRAEAAGAVTRARATVDRENERFAAAEAAAAQVEAERLRAVADQMRGQLASEPMNSWNNAPWSPPRYPAPVPAPARPAEPGDVEVDRGVLLLDEQLREIDRELGEATNPLPGPAGYRPAPPAFPLAWAAGAAGTALLAGIVVAFAVSLRAGVLVAVVGAVLAAAGAMLYGWALTGTVPTGYRRSSERRAPVHRAGPSMNPRTADLQRQQLEVLDRLAVALTARGHPATADTARDVFQRYLAACERRKLEPTPGAPAVDLTLAQARAEQAERNARDLAARADPFLIRQIRLDFADGVDLEVFRALRERARDDLRVTRDALADAERRLATCVSLPQAQSALAQAEGVVAELRRLDRVLGRASEELSRSSSTLLRIIAERITPYLREHMTVVTNDPYWVGDVHELQQRIGASLISRQARLGSHSTAELVYLFTRIELGRHLVPEGEIGPLILDDVDAGLDGGRLRRLLGELRRLALQRQVVVFSPRDDAATWARETMSHDPKVLLHVLTSVDQPPATEPHDQGQPAVV